MDEARKIYSMPQIQCKLIAKRKVKDSSLKSPRESQHYSISVKTSKINEVEAPNI